MEPFSIACTTCQARLRVRDESVIGQILTCPKCGSMVLVEPAVAAADEASSNDPSSPQDSASNQLADPTPNVPATGAEFEDAASPFDEPNEPRSPESPDLTETVEDLAVQAESKHGTSEENVEAEDGSDWKSEPVETDQPDDTASSELSPPPRPANLRPATGEVLLPNAEWTSASTIQWRNRVLIGVAAVAGVVSAFILFVVFSGHDEPPTIASVPTTPKIEPIIDAEPDGPLAREPEAHAPEDTSGGDIAEADPVPLHQEDVSDDASSDAMPLDSFPEGTPEPPIEDPTETPASDITNSDLAAGSSDPGVDNSPTDEPPGLTPKEPMTDRTVTGSESSPLSDTLREFGVLLEKAEEPASPILVVDTELPPASEPDESEVESAVRRTGPRVVELDDRLSDPLAHIEFDGVPLTSFLRFVSDYSTIPITLDADILRWARISPTTAVTLKASNTTVAEILHLGLAPLSLEHRIESDQLFITRRPKDESGMRTVTFKVEDLAGDDPERLHWLGTQIMDFVDSESWSSRGGVGTIEFQGSELVIEQRESVQFEILAFCEKLRVARGLDTRSTFDASMFRLETRGQRARSKLAQSITLTYIRPATLQRIVDRIAKTAKLHILIDWRALATADWSPDAKVRFSVADEPVARALSTLLDPMDLAYRVVDESTLQITTPAVLNSRLEIEFYRVPKLDHDADKLVQSARDALGKTSFRDSGGSGLLVFDEPSDCLLACLSQVRHMELHKWLAARPETAIGSTSVESTTAVSNRK